MFSSEIVTTAVGVKVLYGDRLLWGWTFEQSPVGLRNDIVRCAVGHLT